MCVTPMRLRRSVFVLMVLTARLAAPAAAQTNLPNFQGFQFSFSTPGARASAMGRAFIGVADDATAAVTNPAGLVALTKPQVYVELKHPLRSSNPPRLTARDAFFTLATTFALERTTFDPGFISVAFPIRGRVVVSIAHHRFLGHFEAVHYQPRLSHNGSVLPPADVNTRLVGENNTASIAVLLGAGLRVGVSLSASNLNGEVVTNQLQFTGSGLTATETGVLTRKLEANPVGHSHAVTVGVLYKRTSRFAVGAVFAQSPSFHFQGDEVVPNGKGGAVIPSSVRTLTLHAPSHAGVGMSARPVSRLLVALDVERFRYSSLVRDFVVMDGPTTPANYSVKDGNEIRVGAEYLLKTGRIQVFVRGGVLTTPDHTIEFVPTSNLSASVITMNNDLYNLLRRKAKGFSTAGFGLVFGRRMQADFAYAGNYASLSVMVRLR